MRALARLLLGLLELGQHALARLLEQPPLDVRRQLDREDAEVALLAVELDHGVARRARRLLVGREQRVLQRLDQRVGLDSLVSFELLDELDDLSAHLLPSSIRLPRHDLLVRDEDRVAAFGADAHCLLVRGDDLSAKPLAAFDFRGRPQLDRTAHEALEDAPACGAGARFPARRRRRRSSAGSRRARG